MRRFSLPILVCSVLFASAAAHAQPSQKKKGSPVIGGVVTSQTPPLKSGSGKVVGGVVSGGGGAVPSVPKALTQGDERWQLTISHVGSLAHYSPTSKGELSFAALSGVAETDYATGALRLKPLPGYRLIVLTVEARNLQKAAASLSWIPQEVQCALRDAQGELYPLLLADSPTQGGKSKLVAPGGRLAFSLLFSIPTTVAPQVLDYTLVNFGIGERPQTTVHFSLSGS